jgi:hypothetical protein
MWKLVSRDGITRGRHERVEIYICDYWFMDEERVLYGVSEDVTDNKIFGV